MYLKSLELLRNEHTDPSAPFSVPALKGLHSLTFRKNVSFFVGENGSGKSSLLEAIAYH
jgi:predicted ATPase